ncbi:MAG: glycoside hydrolase family 3 C-terminal domain-containing protein [Bacteroidetes bacterium]|nr:glycoside hydrolase family 3 C-terminal domain-containing protein [Bacteroidota bacterium]
MKKQNNRQALLLFTVLSLLLVTVSWVTFPDNGPGKAAPVFRDLNKNGKMDVYEDARQPINERVKDLLSQMTLEEKAGTLFINGAKIAADGSLNDFSGTGFFDRIPVATQLIDGKKMNHINLWQVPDIKALATWYNNVQKHAEQSRLGIPVTVASDPRNAFAQNIFAMAANGFTLFCEPLGLAAIGDDAFTRKFADIVRQEYVAVGIREALHPMADLATEPRWPRISGTFGEDAGLAARMTKAYVEGLQGTQLGSNSVAAMTKHFSGGGPQKEGLDPHFEFQKGQVYPGNNFKYHLIPFEAAFKAHTSAIMPYYGIPVDQSNENVAFSFNKAMITDLLRKQYKYDGVVCTDWGLITDANMGAFVWPARAWGVEKLTPEERVLKVINAGVDQFGGESVPELVVKLVKEDKLKESRIDESVTRVLRQKFQLGLFDHPYVDVDHALKTVGRADFVKAGEESQRRAMVLLKNTNTGKGALPLSNPKLKIYAGNMDPKVVSKYGIVVNQPAEADIAILRLNTPWVPVETPNFMARMFHHGDLDFKQKERDSILQIMNTVPTIVDIYLDRPAVFPEINAKAKAVLADFGASDAAVMDVIFGKAKPGGKLPFELPSSMEAVRNQKEDLPYDSKNPLYKFGFGLTY